jgi:ribosome-associated heat shock protein Hsp15
MESGQQRLDKWLVVARFARTRRLGTRRITAPDHRVRIGDVLTLALAHATLVVQVCGLSERREGSAEARTLYRELEDGIGPD